MAHVCAIAALGANRALGKDGKLLWRIPEDLKRFKALTMGHPIVLGRKTFESIGKALPGRTNIVVTRDPDWKFEGVTAVHSLEEALALAHKLDESAVYICGGAQLYAEAMPRVEKLCLTLIDDEKEGDAFFPPYEEEFTKKTFEEPHEWNGLTYTWVDLERA